MSEEITLGERIARWREHKGLTQAVLADKIELKPGAVANWEVNTANPTQDNLEKLCDALGITRSQFWGRTPAFKKKSRRRVA